MKVKRLFIWVVSCFMAIPVCHAQQDVLDKASFCCIYTHYVQTKDRENVAVVDSFYSILEVGEAVYKYGELSSYTAQKKYLPSELKWLDNGDCLRDEHLWVTQNYPQEGLMTVEEALHPSFFLYTESMDSMRWEYLTGDSTIMNYTCHRAKVQYAGREWISYYTEEIPVSSGPWKLCGLPGLVLYAQDDSRTHVFQANSIFNVENQPITAVHDKWSTTKGTKRDVFIKTRNKIKSNPKWLTTPYYNDRANVSMAILNAESRKDLGIRPFISVNGIKYPCREREDGLLEYVTNCFQPLELY